MGNSGQVLAPSNLLVSDKAKFKCKALAACGNAIVIETDDAQVVRDAAYLECRKILRRGELELRYDVRRVRFCGRAKFAGCSSVERRIVEDEQVARVRTSVDPVEGTES